jgi:hypothetical protein
MRSASANGPPAVGANAPAAGRTQAGRSDLSLQSRQLVSARRRNRAIAGLAPGVRLAHVRARLQGSGGLRPCVGRPDPLLEGDPHGGPAGRGSRPAAGRRRCFTPAGRAGPVRRGEACSAGAAGRKRVTRPTTTRGNRRSCRERAHSGRRPSGDAGPSLRTQRAARGGPLREVPVEAS